MSTIQDILAPRLDVSSDALLVVAIHQPGGAAVGAGTPLLDLETYKAQVVVESPGEGFVEYLCQVGDQVPTGAVLARLHPQAGFTVEAERRLSAEVSPTPGVVQERMPSPVADAASPPVPETTPALAPRFSKAARQALKRHHLDPALFQDQDLVTLRDVQSRLPPPAVQTVAPTAGQRRVALRFPPLPAELQRRIDWQPLTQAKQLEIQALDQVQRGGQVSLVTTWVRMGTLRAHIARQSEWLPESLLPLVVFETARLLRRHPCLNGFLEGERIGLYRDIHIGIAVDMGQGLKVLTLPHADTLGFRELEQLLFQRIEGYLDRTLTPGELLGSTFTVTDLSGFGVGHIQPLVNAHQSAILGIAGEDPDLHRFQLSLAFDHRVTEGREAALFLQALRERLEGHGAGPETPDAATRPVCGVCLKTLPEDRAMQGHGLLQLVDSAGRESLICQVCLMGY
ncbi:MAG: 2-oxo acid dehydrogenase subunit E2 [Magnetococcales bacterium]|nr:2-oxo acid dehydrogenase subunit E2 [Magnetococcales bacterium]